MNYMIYERKQKLCIKKAHQKAGFNFFDLVTFTYSEEALLSISLQIYKIL
jgi:hypothetical protein